MEQFFGHLEIRSNKLMLFNNLGVSGVEKGLNRTFIELGMC